MPTYRLDDALTKIENYVIDVGDVVEGHDIPGLVSYDLPNGDSLSLDGHRCTTDSHTYLVAGNENLRFVGILYTYGIRSSVRSRIDTELGRRILTETGGGSGDTDDPIPVATDHLFSNVEPSILEDLQYNVRKLSTDSTCTVEFQEDEFGPRRVVVGRRMFPYEAEFGIQDFYRARSNIVETGSVVKRGIERAISLDLGDSSPSETTLSVSPDRV